MDVSVPNAEPIACSLGSGDYRERLAWIADLNAWALREQRREGLTLELVYGPEARGGIHELVRREKACCGFLSFEVQEEPAAIRLAIAAPAEAGSMLDSLFEPFERPAEALRLLRGEDVTRGIFRVDGARTVLEGSLKKSVFLESDLACLVYRREGWYDRRGSGDHRHFYLKCALYGGTAIICPYFHDGNLEYVSILPEAPGPHEDPWAENSSVWKRETLEAQAQWAAAWFTERTGIELPAEFAWGEVSAQADPRSWIADISVEFALEKVSG